MPKLIELQGKTFGRLRVIARAENDKRGKPQWLCECTCDNVLNVSGCNLKTGNTTSCGCLKKEVATELGRLRPYEALYNVLLRSAKHPVFLTYEGFLKFTQVKECHYCNARLKWRPFKGTAYNLDRKDTNKAYSSWNCVPCCSRCNWAKGDHFTYSEWKQLGYVIRGWKEVRGL